MSTDNRETPFNLRNKRSSQDAIEDFFKSYPMYESINLDPKLDSYKKANDILYEKNLSRGNSPNKRNHEIFLQNFSLAESQIMSPNRLKNICSPNAEQDNSAQKAAKPSPLQIIHTNNLRNEDSETEVFKSPLRISHSRDASFSNNQNIPETVDSAANNLASDPEIAIKQLSDEIKKDLFNLQFYANPYLALAQNTDIVDDNNQQNLELSDSIKNLIFNKDEISKLREITCQISNKIMKFLIDDLIEKEIGFGPIHIILKSKPEQKKTHPYKKFLLFEDVNDMLQKRSSIYSQMSKNLEILLNKDKFGSEFSKFFGQNYESEFLNYLVLQENYIWCYVKIKIKFNLKKNTLNITVKLKNPCNGILYEKLTDIKKLLDDLLENFKGMLKNGIIYIEQIKTDLGSLEQNPCSIWNSGIEVYSKLAKDFTNISLQKVDREYIYFILAEYYYRKQNLV